MRSRKNKSAKSMSKNLRERENQSGKILFLLFIYLFSHSIYIPVVVAVSPPCSSASTHPPLHHPSPIHFFCSCSGKSRPPMNIIKTWNIKLQ